jgi:hypothetical protein
VLKFCADKKEETKMKMEIKFLSMIKLLLIYLTI